MFGVFTFLFVLIQLIFQIIPMFVVQRTLYEVRERQARTYHWAAFVVSNIVAELAWNTIMAILSFLVWYYPMGLYRNAEWTDSVDSRGILTVLILWAAFLFASSFAQMLIAALSSAEEASGLATLMGIMLYAFCGILVTKEALPGFWVSQKLQAMSAENYLLTLALDLHVPRQPLHLPRQRLLVNNLGKRSRQLRLQRVPLLRRSGEPNLRRLHAVLH